MTKLTTLMPKDVQGISKTKVIRRILQETGSKVSGEEILDELARLCGARVANSIVYSERRRVADEEDKAARNGATLPTPPSQPINTEIIDGIKTYKKVKSFVDEFGGLAKLQKWLDVLATEGQ